MKKKLAVLLGVLVLSSVGFSAAKKAPASGSSLESSLSNLEAQLQKLEQMEENKFREQEAVANAAQQRLDNYLKMDAAIDQRIADIEANADTSIFGKEFKQKAAEYKKLKEELEKISELLIKGLSKRLEDRNITIKLTKKAMAKIVEDGSIREYGARPLKRSIQKNIEDLLSEELLRNPELSGIINIDYKNDKFVVKKTKR